jgi:MFS family permease
VAGGVFINCGRALLLERSPRQRHARGLARNQLGLLLASPVGAALAGVAAGALGVHASLVLFGVISAAAAAALGVQRALAGFETWGSFRIRKRSRRRAQLPA